MNIGLVREWVLGAEDSLPLRAHEADVREDGSFEIDDVAPGRYTATVIVGDHWVTRREVTVPKTPRHELLLRILTSKVVGRVTSAVDGTPVARVALMAQTRDEKNQMLAVTDDEGRFVLRLLEAGEYDITCTPLPVETRSADHVRLASQLKTVRVEEGGSLECNVALVPGSRAFVEVLSANGVGIVSATVSSLIPVGDASGPSFISGVNTRRDGIAELQGALAPGTYVAQVRISSRERPMFDYSPPLRVELGKDARFRVTLGTCATLRVRATAKSGEPAHFRSITIRDADDRVVTRSLRPGGVESFECRVPVGKLRVLAEALGASGASEVDMSDGKDRDLQVTLAEK